MPISNVMSDEELKRRYDALPHFAELVGERTYLSRCGTWEMFVDRAPMISDGFHAMKGDAEGAAGLRPGALRSDRRGIPSLIGRYSLSRAIFRGDRRSSGDRFRIFSMTSTFAEQAFESPDRRASRASMRCHIRLVATSSFIGERRSMASRVRSRRAEQVALSSVAAAPGNEKSAAIRAR